MLERRSDRVMASGFEEYHRADSAFRPGAHEIPDSRWGAMAVNHDEVNGIHCPYALLGACRSNGAEASTIRSRGIRLSPYRGQDGFPSTARTKMRKQIGRWISACQSVYGARFGARQWSSDVPDCPSRTKNGQVPVPDLFAEREFIPTRSGQLLGDAR